MARNSQTALYINDPVKIVAGVFTIRQAIYVAGIVVLTYGLINATSRLPYGQSGLGQLHILLIVGLPALLTLLVMTFAGSGTVEPYARQFTGYLWRTLLATPRRLAYRMATLARHLVLQRRLCKTAVFSGKSRPMSRLCWPSAPVIAAIRVSRSSTKAALRSYWKNPSL